jgi:hypothetical protein
VWKECGDEGGRRCIVVSKAALILNAVVGLRSELARMGVVATRFYTVRGKK